MGAALKNFVKTALLAEIVIVGWFLWSWWQGIFEVFRTEERGFFDQAQDDIHGVYEEVFGMVAQWEIRYHRHSKYRGQAVRLIESVPGSGGIWTRVTPGLTATTIKLGARSSVSTSPKGGVTWAPSRELPE